MNARRLLAAAFLAGAAAGSVRGAGPPAVPTPGKKLADEPRLAAPLRTVQPAGSLKLMLQSAGKASETALTAEDSLANRRISFLNPGPPARTILAATSDLLAATWSPEGDGWRLAVEKVDRDARSAAKARASLKGRRSVLERWEKARRWSLASPEERRLMRDEDPKMFANLDHPRGDAAARLGFSLPAPMYQQLWSTGFAHVPISQLPAQFQDLGYAWWSGGNSSRTRERMIQHGDLRIAMGGMPERPTVWLQMMVQTSGSTTNLLYPEGWVGQPASQRRAQRLKNPTPVPDDPRFRQRVTLGDQRSGPGLDERPPGAKPLLPLLQDLARQVDIPILAEVDFRPRPDEKPDREDRSWLGDQWWLSGDLIDQPLPNALDMLTADFEYEWHFRRGVLELRHVRWYLPVAEQRDQFPAVIDPNRQPR